MRHNNRYSTFIRMIVNLVNDQTTKIGRRSANLIFILFRVSPTRIIKIPVLFRSFIAADGKKRETERHGVVNKLDGSAGKFIARARAAE